MERRVVVTGIGAITPLGLTAETTWQGMREGRSGIGPITLFDTTDFTTRIAGEVRGFDPTQYMEAREVRHTDRFVQFAIGAAAQAVTDSGLDFGQEDGTRAGVLIGSGIGGTNVWESQHQVLMERGPGRVSPFFIPMLITDMASGRVAMMYGLKGPNMSIVTACATSAHSIGEATEIIARGAADVMVAGGSEAAVTPLSVAGFCAARALSRRNDEPERASRPFDKDRDGFVMGEGAGIVVLEEYAHAKARGARLYGEILGYGASCDAYHITQPSPDGSGQALGMQAALRRAGLAPEAIDYINAHGTATPPGDPAETASLKLVFGEHARQVMVSSTKSTTGHLLGAAGAVELIACLLSMRDQVVPPTINLETPDPECDLDYVPNVARPSTVKVTLSNSFGFGGHNATLIAGAAD